jgi:hypothetical protein
MNKHQKLRVTAVSYLNTKPFIYGIFRSELSDLIDLSLDIPSVCAQKLASGAADLALAPVAVIPDLPESYLVSDFCIGATGPVKNGLPVFGTAYFRDQAGVSGLSFQNIGDLGPNTLPGLLGHPAGVYTGYRGV